MFPWNDLFTVCQTVVSMLELSKIHDLFRHLVLSPCDCDFFPKVKEPLQGIRYNTRDELIRSIGWSIRNINKDGLADDLG